MGKVESLHISKGKNKERINVECIECKKEYGIIGDSYAGKGEKQVSLIAAETIGDMGKCCTDSPKPGEFKENITTSGLNLALYPIGTRIKIGSSVHEISEVGKTCYLFCDIDGGEKSCPIPINTVFTKVIKDGKVAIGDVIEVLFA